ncbi:hypothetical protein BS47DRAFT_1350248 [Hydnum rufescens UP504]|uniref:DNA polymerase epsilon catalytic subunit n=1 Tax=Hydnum rufescens UP504 TaxID=1448309 RepID=A0A9P6AMF6_9AGAM|nr:hypothetical protein BS47DRAFT_1350248 [Hydnum rufescens UP504]
MARGSRGFARGTTFRGNFRGRSGGFRGRGWRGRGGRGGGRDAPGPALAREDDGAKAEEKFEQARVEDEIDEKLGFARFQEGPKRVGWLVNMHPALIKDDDTPGGRAGVDYYFIEDDGGMFKTTVAYEPYFHVSCKPGTEAVVEEWLMKQYEGVIYRIMREKKEDLKLPNHLLGYQRTYLQLIFRNVADLLRARKDLLPLALANNAKLDAVDAYAEVVEASSTVRMEMENGSGWEGFEEPTASKKNHTTDPRDLIIDIREYDVAYYLRVAIDNGYRVGLWYTVTASQGEIVLSPIPHREERAEPVVMAFDIETTKAPLKFPDQAVDQIMMISYMIDGQGFLITNRDIVGEDIGDFEYTPKPEYEGPFTVFNEADEAAVIRRWFEHIQEAKPTVMATFNGDGFDFPFVDARAKFHGIDMFLEIGFAKDSEDEYKSRSCAHMDCFRWVKRDSYLPQGSQGLKAVTTAKLGYNPIELDPELMTPYAVEHPQILAQYSVSDAVATYYLYMKYVHPFIFSLCNIIPLNPDDVLRKGSGTLCETLLMVEAYNGKIIMPNRHEDPQGEMFEGHLIASETYVGGHVEALEAGVFRSDIPAHFKIVPAAVEKLIDDLDAALKFCITQEFKTDLSKVTNYDEVKAEITQALEELRDNPLRTDKPLIYHLDVAAMYPNIMLSNRLQPDSVVTEAMCAVCDFNRPGKTCDRRMTWAWRGEYFPAHRDEFNMVKHALNQESLPPKFPGGPKRHFNDLTNVEQTELLHKRLGDYSRKVYRKTKDTKVVEREAIICQRENPFYIDTVRAFRDRRYVYKGKHKDWKKNLDGAVNAGSVPKIEEAKKMIVLYDSLQLAHKCILNSFYGYVMRKGARWHSMEMAGITCLTGAKIIQMARQLVEQIGRPLELDTDGIWCMLPGSFPENFKFKVIDGKPLGFSYPCTMLNHLVYDGFTNHQYHTFDKNTQTYVIHSENSIFFELDGPYKAMILPSSKEEDKLLKKRYAVFNDDGSLAELKGFEVKRRGELQLIKIFQTQIFERFLLGTTTEECYAAVAKVADRWLDVLFSKGSSLGDDELMVKDKGLACKFIISAKPTGAPVTERAIPVAIFSADEGVKRTYLRKWLHDNRLVDFDLRTILDWNYYIERLGSVIQKLITIPAAMQKVSNPVPRIRHPDWLHKRVSALEDKFQQHKVTDFFKRVDKSEDLPRPKAAMSPPPDIEDFGHGDHNIPRPKIAVVNRKAKAPPEKEVPNYQTDYRGWLAVRRDHGNYEPVESHLPAMFRGAKVKTYRTWEVIQIRPTTTPGRYMLWICLDSEFVAVPLRVPRQFYLNLKVAPVESTFLPSYSAEPVVRSLPRGHPCLNLFKLTVPEDVYQSSESHFANLTSNPNVDGVYETQVSQQMRALLLLGTSCSVDDGSGMTLNRARDVGFDLKQLAYSAPSSTRKYLSSIKNADHIFIFHSTSAPRHVFAIFFPNKAVKVHIVDNAKVRQPLPRLNETYAGLIKEYQKNPASKWSVIEYPDRLDFETSHHSTDAIALKAISREIGVRESGFALVTISSPKDQAYFESGIQKLSKFPILMVPASQTIPQPGRFPMAARCCEENDHSVSSHWRRSIVLCDVDFARRLWKRDAILWWSPGPRPDLGGQEDDEGEGEELSNIQLCSPGSYANVCLSIEVKDLAFNAVMQSSFVNEMEGSGGATAFDSTSHTLDEYSKGEANVSVTLGDSILSPGVFAELKALVRSWHSDKAFSPVPRMSIEHFGRWISSKSSLMYDPGIHRFIHGLMRKTFIQMIAEFKRLGSNVIYADFGNIVLLTSKPPGTASAYATYLLTAVTSHDLFRHIHLRTDRYYDYLLFMDKANQGGVVCMDPMAVEPPTKIAIALNWNIQSFLPPFVQPYFEEAVRHFIKTRYYIHRKHIDVSRTPHRVLQLSQGDPSAIQDDERAKETEAIRKFISEALMRKMLHVVTDILDEYKDAMHQAEMPLEFQFPLLPGSHLNLHNPPLEFIKFVCAAFGCSQEFKVEIGLLKRNLLELVGVREFADEAEFRNPCDPFKLPMVICRLCNSMRDFDFCRDPDLLPEEGPSATRRTPPRWLCEICGCEFDRRTIEASLVDIVRRLGSSYQQQDLQCSKCRQIKSDNLSSHCHCSGTYQLTTGKAETRRRLRTIVNVAIYHNLQLLKEYAEFMLDRW